MANESAKKRLRENAQRLRWIRQIAGVCAALHVLVRLLLRGSRLWERIFFVISLAASGAAYSLMRALARPTYGPQGELLDGGGDVSKAETAQDVVYLMAMIHALTCFTSAAWLLAMAIPGVATSWLWRNVVSPWIFTPREGEEGGPEGPRAARRGAKAERRGGKTPQRR